MNPIDKERVIKMTVYGFLERNLKGAISDEYLNDILFAIRDEVLEDVKETSAYADDGTWNADDIKLALGRVLMNKLGLEC